FGHREGPGGEQQEESHNGTGSQGTPCADELVYLVDLVHLVFLVYPVDLVCFVYLVHLVRSAQSTKPDKPNKRNKPDQPACSRASRATVRGANRPQYMRRVSFMISNDLTRPDTPLKTSVLSHDTVFKRHIGAGLIHCLAHRMCHRFPIFSVHKRQPVILRAGSCPVR